MPFMEAVIVKFKIMFSFLAHGTNDVNYSNTKSKQKNPPKVKF